MLARNLRKLIGNHLIEKVIGYNPDLGRTRHRSQPIHRLLDHRALSIKSQHLLRPRLPATLPTNPPSAR